MFANVRQDSDDTNFEIKYQSLTSEAESVDFLGSILRSIRDDRLPDCYNFFWIGTLRGYSSTCHNLVPSCLPQIFSWHNVSKLFGYKGKIPFSLFVLHISPKLWV